MSADFEVRPIDEGILLSSSALQMLSSVSTSSSSLSGAAVESAVLYSAGYVLQLSGTGAFDSMWISKGEDEEDVSFYSTLNPTYRRGSLVLSTGNTVSALRSADSADIILDGVRERSLEPDLGDYMAFDESASEARSELTVQTVHAIAARRFDVAAIGAGAIVGAYGCRQSRSAVCWLLLLQR